MPRKNRDACRETNSLTSGQQQCTQKRYMEAYIQKASSDKQTCRQRHDTIINVQQAKRQRGVQADMKTWRMTKCCRQ